MGSDETRRLQDALLKRAQDAVEAAEEIVAHSQVLVHVTEDLRELGLTTRCAWCGRYRVEGRWVVLAASPLITASHTSHGICEDCVEALRSAGLSR
jgi:hypothetical protein